MPAFALLLLGPSPADRRARAARRRSSRSPTSASRVVGTLVAALAIQTRARDLIVPLIALPLLHPGRHRRGARDRAAARAGRSRDALAGRWLAVLGLYDLVFGLLAYARLRLPARGLAQVLRQRASARLSLADRRRR